LLDFDGVSNISHSLTIVISKSQAISDTTLKCFWGLNVPISINFGQTWWHSS